MLQAVKDGDLQRVKDLQEQGAYIPLQHAVLWANAQGHLEIVQWLMAQGAVLLNDAYYHALRSGSLGLVKWWWDRPAYAGYLPTGLYEPVIVTALESGSRELVDELLYRGELLPEDPEKRQEILRDLLLHVHEEMFIWLTQTEHWSFEPEKWDFIYEHAMTYALRTGNFKTVKSLVRMGYPVQKLPQKAVFLIYAAHGGSLQAIQWLVQQGVPIQPTKAQYYYLEYFGKAYELGVAPYGAIGALSLPVIEFKPTALEQALAQGHSEIAQWLTEQGARPLAHLIDKPNASEHPDYYSQRKSCHNIQCKIFTYQSMQVADKLRQLPYLSPDRRANRYFSDSPLVTAIKAEHLPLVKYILLRYPEAIQEEYKWESLLHIAVETQSTAMVKFLLEQGVDPFALDYRGQTALDRSIDLHHQSIYNLLRNAQIKAIAERKGF